MGEPPLRLVAGRHPAAYPEPTDPVGNISIFLSGLPRPAVLAELVATFARLGYDAADLGTVEQAVLYIDGARTHLMVETRCSEDEADHAAWKLWPKSMEAEEAECEADW